MSRQPRKVFGFTGGAKYGPVAVDPPNSETQQLVPPSQDMKRKENENNGSNSFDCYKCLCDPNGPICACVTCLVTCGQ